MYDDQQVPKKVLSDWFLESINNFRKPVIVAKGMKSERAEGTGGNKNK